MGFDQQFIDSHDLRIEKNTPGGDTKFLTVNGKERAYCLARNRQTPGQFCQNVAGKKTDHLGYGRCFLHGGWAGRKYRLDGSKSERMEKTIRELVESFINDPNLVSNRRELAVQKAVISKLIDQVDQLDENLDAQVIDALRKWLADTVKTVDKIERSNREAVMTVAQAKYLMSRAVEVQKKLFQEWFPDDDEIVQKRLQQFMLEWRSVSLLVE